MDGIDIVRLRIRLPAFLGRDRGRQTMPAALTILAAAVPVGAAAIIAGVVVLLRGYHFGISDHNEQIPIILHFRDAGYLAHDWYVNEHSEFGPRTYYVVLMASLDWCLELSTAFAAVYALSAVALVGGVMALGRQATGSWTVAALAPIIALVTATVSLGRALPLPPLLLPSGLAVPFVVWALLFMSQRRLLLAGALLAAATYIHPLIGAHGFILTGALAVWKCEVREQLLPAGALYTALASPVLLPALFLWNEGGLTSEEYVEIFAYERAPWHYVFTEFGERQYIPFLSFATIVLAALGHAWFGNGRSYALLVLHAVMVVAPLGFIGYLAVEVWPIKTLAVMQFFRLTVLLGLLASVLVAAWLVDLMKSRTGTATGLFVLGTLLGSTFFESLIRAAAAAAGIWVFVTVLASIGRSRGSRRRLLVAWAGATAALALPATLWSGDVLSAVNAQREAMTDFIGTGSFWLLALLLATLVGLEVYAVRRRLLPLVAWGVLVAVSAFGLGTAVIGDANLGGFRERVDLQTTGIPSVDDVAEYVRKETPMDSVLLVPPYTAEFRLRSERAIVVDFKSFLFEEPGIREWRQRMDAVVGGYPLPEGRTAGWLSLSPEQLAVVACRYDATHVVLENGREFRGRLLFSGRTLQLFAVNCQDSVAQTSQPPRSSTRHVFRMYLTPTPHPSTAP